MKRIVHCLLLAALFQLPAAAAGAHSFRTAFLAPLSGPKADAGEQALKGFLLATKERDGHEGEESQGHLGGLDLYLIGIDSTQGLEAALVDFKSAAAVEPIPFLVALVPEPMLETIRTAVGAEGTFVIAAKSPKAEDMADPHVLQTQDGRSFAEVFKTTYEVAATGPAFAGYRAARLIDRAVRSVAGDFTKRHVLESQLIDEGSL